jgi:hypothetical protein
MQGGRTVMNGNLLTLMRVFLCITAFASSISVFVVWGGGCDVSIMTVGRAT